MSEEILPSCPRCGSVQKEIVPKSMVLKHSWACLSCGQISVREKWMPMVVQEMPAKEEISE